MSWYARIHCVKGAFFMRLLLNFDDQMEVFFLDPEHTQNEPMIQNNIITKITLKKYHGARREFYGNLYDT